MLETDNQCLTRFCNVKSEEMTIIVCCSLCFISDSLKLLKRNYLCICFSLLPHAKAWRTQTQSWIWEGSISFFGHNIFYICLTYATTVYELLRSPMGIVKDIRGMIVCSNLSKFYFYFFKIPTFHQIRRCIKSGPPVRDLIGPTP